MDKYKFLIEYNMDDINFIIKMTGQTIQEIEENLQDVINDYMYDRIKDIESE